MASLIEELITVFSQENEIYKELVLLSRDKSRIIIDKELEKLQEFTAREQKHLEKLVNLEKKRLEVMDDIALVLSKKPEDLTVKTIIALLDGQEKEQSVLVKIHDELGRTLKDIQFFNEMNKNLIEQSLDMIEFDLNIYMGMHQAPEVANYTKTATNAAPTLEHGVFDAKQ